MKNIVNLLALIPIVMSCNSSEVFYYTNECSSPESFDINSDSDVYVRKLYLNEDSMKTTDSISFSNKKNEKNRLIEIQYLIFNTNDEVLYITTKPAPRIYDKSASYQLNSAKNSYPNSYVFNTFYFGELVKDKSDGTRQIVFQDKRNSQRWNLIAGKTNNKTINNYSLISIDNYRIKHVKTAIKTFDHNVTKFKDTILHTPVYRSTENVSLSANHGVDFYKIHRFHYLSFDDPTIKNKTVKDSSMKDYTVYVDCVKTKVSSKYNLYPEAKKIYLKYSGDKLNYIFIPFNMDLNKTSHGIKFNSSWVKFQRGPEKRPKKKRIQT